MTTPPRPSLRRRWLVLALSVAPFAIQLTAAESGVMDLADEAAIKRASATGANLTASQVAGRPVLRVATGHSEPWPGMTLRAPDQPWNLTPFGRITVLLKNTSAVPLAISCRVDNAGADGRVNCISGSLSLNAGEEGTLQVPLRRTSDDMLGGKLFGMRGYPVRAGGPGTVDPAKITQLLIFLNHPKEDHSFEVHGIRADGGFVAPTAWSTDATPFFPLIDTFGQYRHKDWPGKVKSEADLIARRQQEAEALAAGPGPANWSKYGGWAAGPKRRATGYFRTEKVAGKWWLIDPEGHLFFSHGIDCVRMMDATPIEEREGWFADFPGNDPRWAKLRSRGFALKGHYAGRNPECFSFAAANLMRKYGPNWAADYPVVIHQRLRSWGLNTIANWSDERTYLKRQTPYTDNIGSHGTKMIEGSDGYWGKFPDVFDPSFRESLQRAMQAKLGKSAGDPWCLGYFSDNEMSWGDETSLALGALKSPPGQAAKLAFIADLKANYGEIGKLNAAWGASHASWEKLLESRDAPDAAKAKPDLVAFYRRAAESYFTGVKDAIKRVAPNQLYLGCRFAWVNPVAAAVAAKHCDVVSYNLYQRDVSNFQFNGGADVPLIIGEFHFGALDRGMFHTGLVPVESQQARARAYQAYVLGALRHPQLVGCHWFQYQDEPTTGRVYDEENYQIGFVDIADTPYPEIIAASRSVGEQLYAPAAKPPESTATEVLRDKTLVAWITPANLAQRGGSVLTIDDQDSHFDGIVFGELAAGKWMAGSDFHKRSPRIQSDAAAETAGPDTWVQLAIVYRGDRITLYRNGTEYASHENPQPQAFGQDSAIMIGLRHLDAADRACFAGAIDDARVYDLALNPSQLAALKPNEPSDPKPWAWWSFDEAEARERTGRFPITRLLGGAAVAGGRLVLDGNAATMVGRTGRETPEVRVTPAWPPQPPANWLTFHLAHPGPGEAMPGDPNCAFFWKGRYHLHYIYNHRGFAFGHVSSDDLVHWTWHPTTLTRKATGHGMFSGTGFITKEGRPAIIYHGEGSGRNWVAQAMDDNLEQWSPPTAVIAKTATGQPAEVRHWDPDCWLDGDTYYALTGGTNPSLMKSADLKDWTFLGPLLHDDYPATLGVPKGEDISCANMFRIGGKWMLLCISHSLGCRYYLGDFKDGKYLPEFHSLMSWNGAEFFAPESLLTPDGRRVMWAWLTLPVAPGGVQSLPRELSLPADGVLRIRPLRELESLRHDPQQEAGIKLTSGASHPLAGNRGDAVELSVVFQSPAADEVGMTVLGDQHGDHGLTIAYVAASGTLRVGKVNAPFKLKAGEDLSLRVFIDKNLVEVFANDRQAVAAAQPHTPGNHDIRLFSKGGAAEVGTVRSWRLAMSAP